jgi:cell division protein FtsI/penicillin-binding protein 2
MRLLMKGKLYWTHVNFTRMQVCSCLAPLLLHAVLCAQQQLDTAVLDQVVADERLAGRGSVVVMDVKSGKVLAAENLKGAAQVVAAPGSVTKPFVLMELLQSGRVGASERVFCRRKLAIAGRRMDCTHSPAVTDLDAIAALAYSCNSYFANMAVRLSPAELQVVFERAGFTTPSRFTPDEAVGHISLAQDIPHLQLQALGDWGIEITPLELLAAYRELALQKLKNPGPAAAPVFDGLEASVQYGMAHLAKSAGITAAGKTGTAAGRSTPQTHGFFAGYAPADKPQIVLVVYLEQGHGSDAAALAGAIFSTYAKARSGGASP